MAQRALHSVFSDYSSLCNAPQDNVRFTIFDSIKRHHPNHYVVSCNPSDIDLLAFANKGLAKAALDSSDGFALESEREFVPAKGGRTTTAKSTLSDKVYFGKYKYEWKNHEYIVYKVTWKTQWSEAFRFFVLYPMGESENEKAESNVGDEHNCPEIDALLLEVGMDGNLPTKEIWVFEGSWWANSRSMYQSIEGTSWQDVILEPTMKKQIMDDVLTFFQPETKAMYQNYKIPYKVRPLRISQWNAAQADTTSEAS